MSEQVLLDNDVTLKVACYSLADEMLAATSLNGIPPAILGVGRFVIRGRLARDSKIKDVERAKATFERLLEEILLLEPDEAELAIAADLEAEANRRNLELDGGESQLLAILANRACRLLITGDKRAIRAIAGVGIAEAKDRIGCLEQLMAQLVQSAGVYAIRTRVCEESKVDRAISTCFVCSQTFTEPEEVLTALASYIKHLDREAPDVLLPGCDLTALAV
jgi:hypothetical protein